MYFRQRAIYGSTETTNYAILLFFVCVHTNVGYKVVAEFMCQ